MYRTTLSLMIFSLFFTSCCTLTRGRTEPVLVTVEQHDAEIFIDGFNCGTAPLVAELDKRRNHTIIASKPGYEPQKACIQSCRTMGSGFNLMAPSIGAAVGSLVGLAMHGGNGYIFPFFIGGTVVGTVIGLGVGAVGIGTDLCLRSDCDLNKKGVHFRLVQAN